MCSSSSAPPPKKPLPPPREPIIEEPEEDEEYLDRNKKRMGTRRLQIPSIGGTTGRSGLGIPTKR
jgi:hypothetical protein